MEEIFQIKTDNCLSTKEYGNFASVYVFIYECGKRGCLIFSQFQVVGKLHFTYTVEPP